jgi:hypothetical protein
MHSSRVYGIFIDVATAEASRAATFWSAALGVPARPVAGEEQFTTLVDALPELVTAVQAVDDAPRYHLDIETDDVDAEVARLVHLGAIEVSRWLDCHVLRAPGGHLLCAIPVHSEMQFFLSHARTWGSGGDPAVD